MAGVAGAPSRKEEFCVILRKDTRNLTKRVRAPSWSTVVESQPDWMRRQCKVVPSV
jgi:hypothetical protein